MEEDIDPQFKEEVTWLFQPRLQFKDAEEVIRLRISDLSLPDKFRQSKKKQCPLQGQPITTPQHLQRTLDLFNALVFNCRFNEDNLSQNLAKSKNQMKSKKLVKDVDKHSKNKVRRLTEVEGEQSQEEHWRIVLNHKNILEHLHKAYLLFAQFFNLNFDELSQGVFHLKNETLPKELQIKICIVAIDIITLLNTIKFMFLPHSQEEGKLTTLSKLELEEKKLLEEGLQEIDHPPTFSEDYKKLKGLKIQSFFTIIQRIAGELEGVAYAQALKIWVEAFKIKKQYLIEEDGLWKRKFDGKLDSTCIKEICLYWMHINSQHLIGLPQVKKEAIPFKFLFKEYRHLFNFLTQAAIKSPSDLEGVLNYLYLIQSIWFKIDSEEAGRLLWQQLSALSTKKIQFPQDFLKQKKSTILEIGNKIVEKKKATHQTNYLLKAKGFIQNLSKELISLDYLSDFVNDFLLKQLKDLRLLLTERSVFNEEMRKVNKLLQECDDSDVLSLLQEVTKEFQLSVSNHHFCMNYQSEDQTIEELLNVLPNQEQTILEIKYFLLLARNFLEKSDASSLEQCKRFYRKARQQFQSNLGIGPVDIVVSIRIATFQFTSSIKLEKQHPQDDPREKILQHKLQKLIFKLLRIYRLKVLMLKRQEDLQDAQEEEAQPAPPLFERVSSFDVDPTNFIIDQKEGLELVNEQEQREKDDGFTMNLLKKLFELKLEVIHKKIEMLQAQQKPLKQEYEEIKGRVYGFAGGQSQDKQLAEDLNKLPELEYKFIQKRYYQGWKKLRQLQTPIEDILKVLNQAWGSKNNILRLYALIYQKYKDRQLITQHQHNTGELKDLEIENIVTESLDPKTTASPQKMKNLKRAVKILENMELVSILKKQRDEQLEKLQTLEEAKNYRSQKEELKFKELQGKLEICSIFKNDALIMKRYSILRIQPREFDDLLAKFRKLTRFSRNLTLKNDKLKGLITIQVDQHSTSFQSYPKLIKHLIELYLQTIEFCQNHLNFKLYPLVGHRHIKIGKRHENHIGLRFYPYESMILNILMDFKDLKLSKLYRYPQYPFIEFADQLHALIFKTKDRVYDPQQESSEYYAFTHLIEEMKAISMETEGNRETVKRILKCPYFWSSTDKLFELVEFKERYQSNINIQESRRKQNERLLSELSQAEFDKFPEEKHPLYKTASGFNKTTQFYFSIEGLIEKQAFEENIGNFSSDKKDYKYHAYWWIKDKTEIERLIEMVSERERRRGSAKSTVYEKTFNSFQNQIRNLRNLSVHYIYDDQKKREIDLEEKLTIFQNYFPKLFIFLYRWRPYLGKDYVNEIKLEKVKFLKEIFNKEDPREVYKNLQSIKQLSEYNLRNSNGYLMKLFGYDFVRVNGCQPCKIICNSLTKQQSLWSFLQDVKRMKVKEGKDMTFNLLFWEHNGKGCNGMKNLQRAFYNVKQRNQFTTEEFTLGKTSLTLLKIEKERLEQRIKKEEVRLAKGSQHSNMKEEEDDNDSSEENKNKESLDRRLMKFTANERDELYQEMLKTDYVCKYFMYELEMKLPYLFYDLRRVRYQWDDRARQFPSN